jgi:hypothetical protein
VLRSVPFALSLAFLATAAPAQVQMLPAPENATRPRPVIGSTAALLYHYETYRVAPVPRTSSARASRPGRTWATTGSETSSSPAVASSV